MSNHGLVRVRFVSSRCKTTCGSSLTNRRCVSLGQRHVAVAAQERQQNLDPLAAAHATVEPSADERPPVNHGLTRPSAVTMPCPQSCRRCIDEVAPKLKIGVRMLSVPRARYAHKLAQAKRAVEEVLERVPWAQLNFALSRRKQGFEFPRERQQFQ